MCVSWSGVVVVGDTTTTLALPTPSPGSLTDWARWLDGWVGWMALSTTSPLSLPHVRRSLWFTSHGCRRHTDDPSVPSLVFPRAHHTTPPALTLHHPLPPYLCTVEPNASSHNKGTQPLRRNRPYASTLPPLSRPVGAQIS